MWSIAGAFIMTYWPGLLVGGLPLFVLGYMIAKTTASSPVWEELGEFVIRQIKALGVVTKEDIRDTTVGASAAVNSKLDKIDPKDFKRAPIKARVVEALVRKVPGGNAIIGAVNAVKWLRNRRKRRS